MKILGYGEIGRGVHEVYKRAGWEGVAWKDLNGQEGPEQCDILHVCIPFTGMADFVDSVIEEVEESIPDFIVIHSTVQPGTTETLRKDIMELLDMDPVVVHSPVIGVHPNLADGILTFTKWIGCEQDDFEMAKNISDHFSSIHVDCRVVTPAAQTEIMKVWDTTYYGNCLAINAEVRKMLEENGCRYDTWVEYLKAYNQGYQALGMSNVTRPYFPNLTMPLGGHCITPNQRILSQITDSSALDMIKKFDPDHYEKTI